MKRVVLKPTDEVSIDSITNESIVGVILRSGKKAYLCYFQGYTIAIRLYSNSISDMFVFPSKIQAVRLLIENYQAKEVYLFDTEEDIINWLKS